MTTVSLDEPTRYPPTQEVWLEARLDWEAANAALRPHRRDGV